MDDLPPWFGRCWRHIGLKVQSAGLHRQSAGLTRWMKRTMYALIAVRDGEAVFEQGSRRLTMAPGSLAVFPPGMGFTGQAAGRLELLGVDFHVLSTAAWGDPFAGLLLPQVVQSTDQAPIVGLQDDLLACFTAWRPRSIHLAVAARAYLDLILLAYLSAGFQARIFPETVATPPRWIADLLDHLNRQLQDSSLRLADLCAQTGYSASHISHTFQRYVGQGPMDYLQRERVALAAQLLRADPGRAIGDIARRCGYADGNLLARHFRRHFGMSPRRWRQGASWDGLKDLGDA